VPNHDGDAESIQAAALQWLAELGFPKLDVFTVVEAPQIEDHFTTAQGCTALLTFDIEIRRKLSKGLLELLPIAQEQYGNETVRKLYVSASSFISTAPQLFASVESALCGEEAPVYLPGQIEGEDLPEDFPYVFLIYATNGFACCIVASKDDSKREATTH